MPRSNWGFREASHHVSPLAGARRRPQQCVDLLNRQPPGINLSWPDLTLMDIPLGGEHGLDSTRRLKDEPTTASIPVVALTARAMAGDRHDAMAAGCCGYISKPIDTRTFVVQIKAFLPPPPSAGECRDHQPPEGC